MAAPGCPSNLPLPPLSTPVPDTALPTSTGAPGPTVNLGDWQEGFSGAAAGDGLQGAQIVAATGMGSMTLPRTEGLGDTASMADLVAAGALPGRQGVILTDPASNPAALFGDMYDLGQQTGVEYALTNENGQLVLYSGAPNKVITPGIAEPIAHTHPDGLETLPSTQDIQILNEIWINNPAGPRPSSTVIWGSGPDDITIYNATGFDKLIGSK